MSNDLVYEGVCFLPISVFFTGQPAGWHFSHFLSTSPLKAFLRIWLAGLSNSLWRYVEKPKPINSRQSKTLDQSWFVYSYCMDLCTLLSNYA